MNHSLSISLPFTSPIRAGVTSIASACLYPSHHFLLTTIYIHHLSSAGGGSAGRFEKENGGRGAEREHLSSAGGSAGRFDASYFNLEYQTLPAQTERDESREKRKETAREETRERGQREKEEESAREKRKVKREE